MAINGFTKINNSVLFDCDLSLEAIGLYIKLKYFYTIDGFKIRRDHIKSISGYGETAFRRVWKELKDKNILIETKLRVNGKYEYEFKLAEVDIKNNNSDTRDKESYEPEDENIEMLSRETEFTKEESKQLLKEAKDIKEVLKYYRYTLKQKNVKNIFNYTKMCILKRFNIPKENKIKGSFNNYEQRRYDFNKLESAIYGECSLNEAIIY